MADHDREEAARLLRRAQGGDSAAWGKLVRDHQSLVYSIAVRSGLSRDDAEDVFQATFLALYKNLDRIEEPRALRSWLAVAAAREAVRVRRITGKHESVGDPDLLESALASDEANAEELATSAESADAVRSAVEELGGKCAELLNLLYSGDEPSYTEISDRLGMPIGSIGPSRNRCLEKLRGILAKRNFFDRTAYQAKAKGALKSR